MNVLLDFILAHVIKMQFLEGYRTYLGGAGMVFGGAALIANQVATTVYDHDTMEKGFALMCAGFVAIGHAGKQDRILLMNKTTATATSATALTSASGPAITTASNAIQGDTNVR